MELKLKNKHAQRTIKGESEREPKVDLNQLFNEHNKPKKDKYDTTQEKYICESYENGLPLTMIVKNSEKSKGFIYSTLRKYGIKERRLDLGKVHGSVKHIVHNTDKLNKFIEDYYVLSLDEIMWKYKIHKNGVYYILDTLDIPRKRGV